MASQRLMAVAQAAGCAMAPTEEYLDGPSNVMPRPQSDFFSATVERNTGNELTVTWLDVSNTARLRAFVGNLWYGRATPA